jgi:hypothetical protein
MQGWYKPADIHFFQRAGTDCKNSASIIDEVARRLRFFSVQKERSGFRKKHKIICGRDLGVGENFLFFPGGW